MQAHMTVQKGRKHVVAFSGGATDRCILCLLTLIMMCHGTHQYTLGTMTSWSIGQTIIGNNIRTIQVQTKNECALQCVVDISCQAAAVYCKSPQQTGSFDCELNYASYTIVNNSDMCYSVVQSRDEYVNGVNVNDLSTTTVPPAMTTTTAAPSTVIATISPSTVTSQIVIRAGIGNLDNMCSSSSSTDIALIMDDGVYIYDDLASLQTGSCKGPLALSTIFSGYSSVPEISNIVCLMVYQNNEIDMLDNSQVWRWQVQSNNLWSQSSQSFPKSIATLLSVSSSNIPPSNSDWCVNRDRNGRQDRFFYNNGMLYFYSSQSPYTDTFLPSATGISVNNYNLNPWTNLPSEPLVAVFSLTTDNDDFLMIGQSRTLYRYQMDHTIDSNNPPISQNQIGTLVI